MPRLACFALAAVSCLAAPAVGAPPWLSDLEEARRLAARTGRPIFIVFRCEH